MTEMLGLVGASYSGFKESYMIPLLWVNIINQLGSAVGLLLLWWYFLHWGIRNYQ